MRSICVFLGLAVWMAGPLTAQEPPPRPSASPEKAPKADKGPANKETKLVKCEAHGVGTKLCARCNPKLGAVFKAKGDWCAEHHRPESQCVLCQPELAKKGVK